MEDLNWFLRWAIWPMDLLFYWKNHDLNCLRRWFFLSLLQVCIVWKNAGLPLVCQDLVCGSLHWSAVQTKNPHHGHSMRSLHPHTLCTCTWCTCHCLVSHNSIITSNVVIVAVFVVKKCSKGIVFFTVHFWWWIDRIPKFFTKDWYV